MRKLDGGIPFFFFFFNLGMLWTCELAHSCPQQNAVIYWGKLNCKTFLPHTPIIQKKKKSTAWLSLNNWLFIFFHGTQRANPEATWATNAGSDGDHHGTCHSLLTTHKTHWLQLYEVKIPKKKKMWRRCPQLFLSRGGAPKKKLLHLDIENKASLRLGYNRLGHLLL